MSDVDKRNTGLETLQRAYRQLHAGSATLLDDDSTNWVERQLIKQVFALSKRRLDKIGEVIPTSSHVVVEEVVPSSDDTVLAEEMPPKRDTFFGDQITVGPISGSSGGLVIGRGAIAKVALGKDQRDEQYEIAMNWDGQRPMRGFDLSERDLSGLNLTSADLRKAKLREADLSKTNLSMANLSEADLSEANLSEADLYQTDLTGAKYTVHTIWPDGFDPNEAGAIVVDEEANPIENSE